MTQPVHRVASLVSVVCGAPRLPFGFKATNIASRVTCPVCIARKAAYRKSAKARSAGVL